MNIRAAACVLAIAWGVLFADVPPVPGQAVDSAVSARTPSDQLRKEHRIILRVIDAAKQESAAIRSGKTTDLKRIRQMVDFFSNYVQSCHYAKEERFYFPAAAFHNPDAAALVGELKMEHLYSRSIVEELRYVLDYDRQDLEFIAERLQAYAALVEAHFTREHEQLFPKADAAIAGAEERAVLMGFEMVEQVELGSGFGEKYREMARELTEPTE